MNIGNKIKQLRKNRGITQEQLAESIGISFQAVSKWENNVALPDISLLPVLANYFSVSIDELFDFSLEDTEMEIKGFVDEALKTRETNPFESKRILEGALRKYPDNDVLLCNLLYVLNYSENPDETISVASKIIERTTKNDLKFDALRFLAYAYKSKGDIKSAKIAIEQIPDINFNKLTEIAYLLSGKDKFEAAEKQKRISFENLIQMMWKLAEYYEETSAFDKAVKETENALKLISVINHSQFDIYIDFFKKQIKRLSEK